MKKTAIWWFLSACYISSAQEAFLPDSDFREFSADPLIWTPPVTELAEQRNYQTGLASTYNLEPAHNEPYHLDFRYHKYDSMTRFLRATTSRFPNLTALYSIGKSVQGKELWVMVVSASPYEHMIGKPDVKYVSNMHGNEAVSRELMLHLIHHLATNYNTDDYIRWLLDNTRIHIMPSMNPDGFEVAKEGVCEGGQGRYNARGFDLNRNFPDYFKQNNKRTQPETEAVKEWLSKIQFVLSGNLHGGALVASYPFDNTPNSLFQSYTSPPSVAPDDDVFKHLALTYSTNHPKMSRGISCKSSTPGFKRGITNGAAWYPLTGGMQDYNYIWFGTMEITLELSCCKYPPAKELPKYWEDNRQALIKFLAEAHRGVHGFVMDEHGNPIEKASLKISTRDIGFRSTKYGEFWRILLPGVYKLEVYADGYVPREVEFMVVEQHPTLLNVTLHPAKCISCGPGRTGQCFGANICCGPFGCLFGTAETLRCQREGLFHETEPCTAGSSSCKKNNGRCAADGICCNQDSCHVDKTCSSLDEKIRLQDALPIDIYNLLSYPNQLEYSTE